MRKEKFVLSRKLTMKNVLSVVNFTEKKKIIIIIATVSFLSNCIMIPDILTNLFFKKTFWMTAFNTIKFVPM